MIVEDEFLAAEALRITMEGLGVEVLGHARDPDEAERMAEELDPDLVLMDVRLGSDRDGVDASIAIGRLSEARIIFITGSAERETLERIKLDHPFRILIKPVDVAELREAVCAPFAEAR